MNILLLAHVEIAISSTGAEKMHTFSLKNHHFFVKKHDLLLRKRAFIVKNASVCKKHV